MCSWWPVDWHAPHAAAAAGEADVSVTPLPMLEGRCCVDKLDVYLNRNGISGQLAYSSLCVSATQGDLPFLYWLVAYLNQDAGISAVNSLNQDGRWHMTLSGNKSWDLSVCWKHIVGIPSVTFKRTELCWQAYCRSNLHNYWCSHLLHYCLALWTKWVRPDDSMDCTWR